MSEQKNLKTADFIRKIIIFTLFVLNLGVFIYVRVVGSSYATMLKLNNMMINITLTGILLFLMSEMYLTVVSGEEKTKGMRKLKALMLQSAMIFITFTFFFREGFFVHTLRLIGFVAFFKYTFAYFILFAVIFILLVFVVWKVDKFYPDYGSLIYFGLGFILLLYFSFNFIGMGSYAPEVPWLYEEAPDKCTKAPYVPRLFEGIHYPDNMADVFKTYNEYDYNYGEYGYSEKDLLKDYSDYDKAVSNISIFTGIFIFFIIIISTYNIRSEYYLAVLASLLALANSSLFAFYYRVYRITEFPVFYKVVVSNDFHFITSILLPATLLLKNKQFLEPLFISIIVYFILFIFIIFPPNPVAPFIIAVADIIFMTTGFIYLYKYNKTAEQHPEIIKKNRFLKKYLN